MKWFILTFIALYSVISPVTSNALDCAHRDVMFYNNTDVNAPAFCPIARDCKAWYDAGINESGIYPIKPDDGESFQVYCDMETDGGGWTVFQRRQDGSVDFYRTYAHYERGFGNLSREHWLGLSKIHRLTPSGDTLLRIDLGDFSSNYRYARYEQFEILDAYTQYTIAVHGYSGNAGDALSYHNLNRFSTRDRDHDRHTSNCAVNVRGAWWFNACIQSNLNGQYHTSPALSTPWHGVMWYSWRGNRYSLRFSEMKLRRKD